MPVNVDLTVIKNKKERNTLFNSESKGCLY